MRAFIDAGGAALRIDALELASGGDVVTRTLEWSRPRLREGPVLIYSTSDPATVQAVQLQLGTGRAGSLVEHALGAVARGLVEQGVRQIIVAGGETSGACVQALDVTQLRIGPQIDPGVPWCYAQTKTFSPVGVHLALKSGNFGADDFFHKAFALLR